MKVFLIIVFIIWHIIYLVQLFMGYGTAYRQTKKGGDTGVALFGWMIVYMLAAIIPGLGIYLWKQSKK